MVPLIIAHRGNSHERPENTLVSLENAIEVGADMVEFDVQLTKDQEVVLIHDPTVDRTTNGKGKVREMSLSEIKELSAGYAERFGPTYARERVPTLAEALHRLRGRIRLMIEIKKDSPAREGDDGIEALSVAAVREAGMVRDVTFISFERRALLRCRELAPEIRRGHLFYRAEPDEVLAGAREVESDFAMPEKGMLTEALHQKAQEAKLKIATWVVDEPDELRALSHFDLYGVGSNRPGVLLNAMWECS